MKSQLLTLVALSPLAAYALPKQPRHYRCGKPRPSATTTVTTGLPLSEVPTFTAVPVESLTTGATTYSTDYLTTETPTTTVTTGLPLSEVPTFTAVPVESLPTGTTTYSTDYITQTPTTTVTTGLPLSEIPSFSAYPVQSLPTLILSSVSTVTTGLPLSEIPSFTVVPVQSLPTSTFTTFTISSTAETPSYPVASDAAAAGSQVADGKYAEATQIAFKVPATEQCGNEDRLVLPGMPWTVANSMYNADQMVGRQCTNFEGILKTTDGTKEVRWTSVTDVERVDETKDVCKGYTNIGIGKNLNKKLKDIKSIPAYYKWDRTNTTEFRGSNLFDFVTAPTPGDGTSTATSEFMLWVRNWGDQVPIGYARGPVATLTLFGARWKLYEGQNPASGVTVRSLLADAGAYDGGVFRGDLKEWLDAMARRGYVSSTDYVTVGNAGTEIFYGKSVMDATVALDIIV
ncbi:glycoside hydrolase family 12 protein [Xylaria palmicola]|nr:glycoside hydrolase family 12 protein [Xylaria palmicola]